MLARGATKPDCRVTSLTERKLLKHMQEILRLDRANFPGEPWSRTEFLASYQKKWALSKISLTEPAGRREVAGYIIAYLYNRHFVHISRLAVKKCYRGSGVSRRLLQAVEKIAKRVGATEITVEVAARALRSPEKYQKARRFYARQGFAPISGQQLVRYLDRKEKLALSGEYLSGQEQHTVFRLTTQHPKQNERKNARRRP